MTGPRLRLIERDEDGATRPMLVWDAGPGWRMISSGVVGGGIGDRAWWLNAGVARDYSRTDLATHLGELACVAGLSGHGVGMLTAADVRAWTHAEDGGVQVAATVGLGVPVPAAAAPERIGGEVVPTVGTINVLVVVPAPLTDAALVNAVLTLTEAKTQALVEHGVPGTGTSSDSVCIACPIDPGHSGRGAGREAARGTCQESSPGTSQESFRGTSPGTSQVPEPFCGPRSLWGARLARAVHAAVGEGTASWLRRHPAGDPHRFWPTPPASGDR